MSGARPSPSPVTAAGPGGIDAVLLHHDTHDGNLDHAGGAFLPEVPIVFTTDSGAGRLGGNAHGLAFWQTAELQRPDGATVTVTGVPARHGPIGREPVTGDVVGFILTSVLFLGSARMAFAFDSAPLTLDSPQGAEAAKVPDARRVAPSHFDSWAHFKEGRNEIEAAFIEAGLADRLDFAR